MLPGICGARPGTSLRNARTRMRESRSETVICRRAASMGSESRRLPSSASTSAADGGGAGTNGFLGAGATTGGLTRKRGGREGGVSEGTTAVEGTTRDVPVSGAIRGGGNCGVSGVDAGRGLLEIRASCSGNVTRAGGCREERHPLVTRRGGRGRGSDVLTPHAGADREDGCEAGERRGEGDARGCDASALRREGEDPFHAALDAGGVKRVSATGSGG
jgi:hypothetical protein